MKAKVINDYFFENIGNFGELTKPEGKGSTRLSGVVTKKDGTESTIYVKVKKFKRGIVLSYNDKRYELGEINKDYRAYRDAVENNVPILKDWNVKFDKNEKKYIFTASYGYRRIKGEVTKQEGNFIWINYKKFFCMWSDMRTEDAFVMRRKHKVAEIRYPEEFKEFLHEPWIPVFKKEYMPEEETEPETDDDDEQ